MILQKTGTRMQEILKELKAVDGVTGFWLYDPESQILHCDVGDTVPKDLLDETTMLLSRVAESIEFHYGQWESFTAEYPAGNLLVRNLTPGGLVILTAKNANPATISVSANVVVGKLRKMFGTKERSGSQPAFSDQMEPVDTGSIVNAPVLPPTNEQVSDVFMEELNKTLADYMGPASAILIKRTLRKMGIVGRRAPKALVRDLLTELEQKIPHTSERVKFHAASYKQARFHGVDR